MTILMEPLDSSQAELLNIVWPVFAEHGRFPVYNYVEYHMQQRGLDAAEVLSGMPSIGNNLYHGGYRAVWAQSGGGVPQQSSHVCLTMAGLFHVKNHDAMNIIGAVLAYLRQLSQARTEIAKHPFDVPNVNVDLQEALKPFDVDEATQMRAAAIAEHEWLSMRVHRQPNTSSVSGQLNLLTDADFHTIEEYLNAITAATTPQLATTILEYRDPRALARAITNFDITCELVLKAPLVKKPALDRTALFVQDATSHSDLQAGVSALGELLSDLQVPGKKSSHAIGRLLDYLTTELPAIDQARVQEAIDLADAVREIRNSGLHPRPSAKLISAHELLGLPFPLRDPAEAWRIIRAQMDAAFGTLQEEIYAARSI